jgi:hypothetical protein
VLTTKRTEGLERLSANPPARAEGKAAPSKPCVASVRPGEPPFPAGPGAVVPCCCLALPSSSPSPRSCRQIRPRPRGRCCCSPSLRLRSPRPPRTCPPGGQADGCRRINRAAGGHHRRSHAHWLVLRARVRGHGGRHHQTVARANLNLACGQVASGEAVPTAGISAGKLSGDEVTAEQDRGNPGALPRLPPRGDQRCRSADSQNRWQSRSAQGIRNLALRFCDACSLAVSLPARLGSTGAGFRDHSRSTP